MSLNILFISIYTFFSVLLHEYYLSVSMIKYTNNGLEIEIRVFKDDLEKVLNEDYENLEKNPVKAFMYFEKHFLLYDDQKPIKILFKDIKDKGDAVLIHGTVSIDEIKRLRVKNTIFIEQFSTQKNIVHIYHYDKIKTTVLDSKNTEYLLP